MAGNRLEHLTKGDWILLLAKAKRRKFKPGEQIIGQGSPGRAVYIIRAGFASVALTNRDRTTEIAVLGPEEICGDMAFLEKGKATAAVVAKDEVDVDEIEAKELEHLFECFPGVGTRFYRSLALVLSHRLRDTSKELAKALSQGKR